ncbi:hypothetical protein [Streptomyces sp. NRRL S-118]|uniref:hypothetical protein n=1 Tax=Streptomyces sp. NRRL S-118 TaxID=1463881 RepID=UPI00131AC2C7|nr:hypothetical protein [Streptomyces sp. NRRL S-118]
MPAAAPRTVRGAARRRARRHLVPVAAHRTAAARALGIALFLGGLLALGFLCGGRAYAAESPEPAVTREQLQDRQVQETRHTAPEAARDTRESAGGTAAHAAQTVRESARSAEWVQPVQPVQPVRSAESAQSVQSAGPVTGPVAESVVRPAAGRVLPPVTGTVTTVSAAVTGAVVSGAGDVVGGLLQGVAGAVPDPAGHPTPPGLLPVLPGASAVAGADAPAEAAGAGTDPRAAAAPQADAHRSAPARTSAAAVRPYAGDGGSGSVRTRGERAPALSAPTPVVPAPWGGAGGRTPGCAGDGGSPRAADQHAVTAASVPHPGPVRGAGLPATAAPLRDRPHDVLEFPG